jgi:dephospho-CoA kinase
MMLSLVVHTGASAVGKTTVARCVETQPRNHQVHFFDSIGVPSIEQMREAHGLEHDHTLAAWQVRWLKATSPRAALKIAR